MDDNERIVPDGSAEQEREGKGSEVDLPSATIIGANITGINAGTGTGGIVAPAASAAAAEAADEGVGPLNLDVLGRSAAAAEGEQGDAPNHDVSARQRELEADESNG